VLPEVFEVWHSACLTTRAGDGEFFSFGIVATAQKMAANNMIVKDGSPDKEGPQ
jgi:hypothetical protein